MPKPSCLQDTCTYDFRSPKVKGDGAIGDPIYGFLLCGFLLMFNANLRPNSAEPFTRYKASEYDWYLFCPFKSPKVKCNGAIELRIIWFPCFLLVFNSSILCDSVPLLDIRSQNLNGFDLTLSDQLRSNINGAAGLPDVRMAEWLRYWTLNHEIVGSSHAIH